MKGWDGSHKWLYLYLAYTLELITYFTATSHIYNSAHSLQNRNRQRHRSYQIIFLINSPFVGSETDQSGFSMVLLMWVCGHNTCGGGDDGVGGGVEASSSVNLI